MTTELVHVKDPRTNFQIEYAMDVRLKKNLETGIIPDLKTKDKDCFLVIDGKEGSGKSTFAIQIGKYVDPTLDLNRIVFSPDDFRDAILKAKKGQCIIYDEAFTGFSSRSSLSPVNRVLVSLAMQMRQKNLFIIIVLPTIFLLDKYIAIFRTRALIHVYEISRKKSKSNQTRGYFKVFNSDKKRLLILKGQKTMTYKIKGLHTRFRGRFYGKFALGSPEVEIKYRLKKEKALADSEKTSMNSAQVKYKDQRDLMISLFKRYTKLTYKEIAEILIDYDFNMSFQQIAKICAKFGEIRTLDNEKPLKAEVLDEKEEEIEADDTFDGDDDEKL